MSRTTGDQYKVACPTCGQGITHLWECMPDPGDTVICYECGKEATVVDIETTCTVTLEVGESC